MGLETPTPPELENNPTVKIGSTPVGNLMGVVKKTKERATTFFSYNQLKFREYFGKIDENQLQSLLEIEFEKTRKDITPILGVFDPEFELQDLRILPHNERRASLADFKSKLARQGEAWATCRTFLRRKIEVNHDVEKQDLLDWIDTFSNEYGFTDSQKQTAEEIINDYYENRKRVKEIMEQYPNNVELVSELSGQTFSADTKFRTTIGPMSVNIYCDSFTAGRLFTSESNPQKTKWSAFACLSDHQPPIPYNVFNISTLQQILDPKINLSHENQHQENKLFSRQFDQPKNESWSLWNQYLDEQDVDTKRTLLESYLKAERDRALARAKDELIAMKKPKNARYPYDIWFKQDNSPHDYLSWVRDREDSNLYIECSQKLLVEEYQRIIEDAVATFDRLKKKGGHSINQTIALLTDKPLDQWPKTARRLLEEEK